MTVALFDKRTVLRDALKLVFSSNTNIRAVCENDNIYTTLNCVRTAHPDIILIDPALFGKQLLHFIHVIMRFNPLTKFVLLPASDNMTLSEEVRNERSIIVISSSDGMEKLFVQLREVEMG